MSTYTEKVDTTNPTAQNNETLTDSVGVTRDKVIIPEEGDLNFEPDSLNTDSLNQVGENIKTEDSEEVDDDAQNVVVDGVTNEDASTDSPILPINRGRLAQFLNGVRLLADPRKNTQTRQALGGLLRDENQFNDLVSSIENDKENTKISSAFGIAQSLGDNGLDSLFSTLGVSQYGEGEEALRGFLYGNEDDYQDDGEVVKSITAQQQTFQSINNVGAQQPVNPPTLPVSVQESYGAAAQRVWETQDDLNNYRAELAKLRDAEKVDNPTEIEQTRDLGVGVTTEWVPNPNYDLEAHSSFLERQQELETKIHNTQQRLKAKDFLKSHFETGKIDNFSTQDESGNWNIDYGAAYLDYLKDVDPEAYEYESQKLNYLNAAIEGETPAGSFMGWIQKYIGTLPIAGSGWLQKGLSETQADKYAPSSFISGKPGSKMSLMEWVEEQKLFNVARKYTWNDEYEKRFFNSMNRGTGEYFGKDFPENKVVRDYLKDVHGIKEDEFEFLFLEKPFPHTTASKQLAIQKLLYNQSLKGVELVQNALGLYIEGLTEDYTPYHNYIDALNSKFNAKALEIEKLQEDFRKKYYKQGHSSVDDGKDIPEYEILDEVSKSKILVDEHNAKLDEINKWFDDEENAVYSDETSNKINNFNNNNPVRELILSHLDLYDKGDLFVENIKEDKNFAELIAYHAADKTWSDIQAREIRLNREKILRGEGGYSESLNQALFGVEASINGFSKGFAQAPRTLDGEDYTYADYFADMMTNSIWEDYEKSPRAYSEAMFNNVAKVKLSDSKPLTILDDGTEIKVKTEGREYQVYLNDNGVPYSQNAVRDETGLPILNKEIEQQVLDEWKTNPTQPESVRNKNLPYKFAKLMSDLAFQVTITKLAAPVISGALSAPIVATTATHFKNALPNYIKWKHGASVLPMSAWKTSAGLSSKTIGAASSYGGVSTAIFYQTHNEFYDKAMMAGLYDNARAYTLAQVGVISMINMINPNVRMSGGARSLVEKAMGTRTPVANFQKYITVPKGLGAWRKWLAFGNPARAFAWSNGRNIAYKSLAEGVEEWAELYGELGTNLLVENASSKNYKFQIMQAPSVNMQAESFLLGMMGGATHATSNGIGKVWSPDAAEVNILLDYVENVEEFEALIDKLTEANETVFFPQNAEIKYSAPVGSTIQLNSENVEAYKAHYRGVGKEIERIIPINASDEEKLRLTALAVTKMRIQYNLDNTSNPLLVKKFKDDLAKVEEQIKGIQNQDGGPLSFRNNIDKKYRRAQIRVNGEPVTPTYLQEKILNDETFVEGLINGDITIVAKYLPKKIRLQLEKILLKKDAKKKSESENKPTSKKGRAVHGPKYEQTDDSTGEVNEEYEDLGINNKTDKRWHVPLPNGGILQVTKVKKKKGSETNSQVYFRYVSAANKDGNRDEVLIYYNATPSISNNRHNKNGDEVITEGGRGYWTGADISGSPITVKYKKAGKSKFTSIKGITSKDGSLDFGNAAGVTNVMAMVNEAIGKPVSNQFLLSNIPSHLDLDSEQQTEQEALESDLNEMNTLNLIDAETSTLVSLLLSARRLFSDKTNPDNIESDESSWVFENASTKVQEQLEVLKTEVIKRLTGQNQQQQQQQQTQQQTQQQQTTAPKVTTPPKKVEDRLQRIGKKLGKFVTTATSAANKLVGRYKDAPKQIIKNAFGLFQNNKGSGEFLIGTFIFKDKDGNDVEGTLTYKKTKDGFSDGSVVIVDANGKSVRVGGKIVTSKPKLTKTGKITFASAIKALDEAQALINQDTPTVKPKVKKGTPKSKEQAVLTTPEGRKAEQKRINELSDELDELVAKEKPTKGDKERIDFLTETIASKQKALKEANKPKAKAKKPKKTQNSSTVKQQTTPPKTAPTNKTEKTLTKLVVHLKNKNLGVSYALSMREAIVSGINAHINAYKSLLKQIGITQEDALELFLSEDGSVAEIKKLLDTPKIKSTKPKNQKGLDAAIKKAGITMNSKVFAELIDDILNALTSGSITAKKAADYLLKDNVLQQYLSNTIGNYSWDLSAKRLGKVNQILQAFEGESQKEIAEKISIAIKRRREREGDKSIKALKEAFKGGNVDFEMLKLAGKAFFGRHKGFDALSKAAKQMKRLELSKMFESMLGQYGVRFTGAITSSLRIDSEGNLHRHEHIRNEGRVIDNVKQKVNKIFSQNLITGRMSIRQVRQVLIKSLGYDMANFVIEVNGLRGEFKKSTKKYDAKWYKENLSDSFDINISLRTTSKAIGKKPVDSKGDFVLEADSQRILAINSEGDIVERVVFKDFAGTDIGSKLVILYNKTDNTGKLYYLNRSSGFQSANALGDTQVVDSIESESSSEVYAKLKESARVFAEQEYDNIDETTANIDPIKESDLDNVLTLSKEEPTIDPETGQFIFPKTSKKVHYSETKDYGTGDSYLSLNTDEKLSNTEILRLMRYAHSLGFSGVVMSGLRSNKALFKQISNNVANVKKADFDVSKLALQESSKGNVTLDVASDMFANSDFFDVRSITELTSQDNKPDLLLFKPAGLNALNGGILSPHNIFGQKFTGGYGATLFADMYGANMYLDGVLTSTPNVSLNGDIILDNYNKGGYVLTEEQIDFHSKRFDNINQFLLNNTKQAQAVRQLIAFAVRKSIKMSDGKTSDFYEQFTDENASLQDTRFNFKNPLDKARYEAILEKELGKFVKAAATQVAISMMVENSMLLRQGDVVKYSPDEINFYLRKMTNNQPSEISYVDISSPEVMSEVVENGVVNPIKYGKLTESQIYERAAMYANQLEEGESNIDNTYGEGFTLKNISDAKDLLYFVDELKNTVGQFSDAIQIEKSRVIQEFSIKPSDLTEEGTPIDFVHFDDLVSDIHKKRIDEALNSKQAQTFLYRMSLDRKQKIIDSKTYKDLYANMVQAFTSADYHQQLNPGNVKVNEFMMSKLGVFGSITDSEYGTVVTQYNHTPSNLGNKGINNELVNEYIQKDSSASWNPFTGNINLQDSGSSLLTIDNPGALLHEMGHIWIRLARGRYGEELNRIYNLIENSSDPDIVRNRKIVNQLYASQYNDPRNKLYYQNDKALTEEVFVQMLSNEILDRLISENQGTASLVTPDMKKLVKFFKEILNFFTSSLGFPIIKARDAATSSLEQLMTDIVEKEFIWKDGEFGVTRAITRGARNSVELNFAGKKLQVNLLKPLLEYFDTRMLNPTKALNLNIESIKSKNDNEKFAVGLAYRNNLHFYASKEDLGIMGKAWLYLALRHVDSKVRLKQFADAVKKGGFTPIDNVIDNYALRDGKVLAKQDIVAGQVIYDNTGKRQSLLERLEDEVFSDKLKTFEQKQEAFENLMYALNALHVNERGFRQSVDQLLESRKDLREKANEYDQTLKDVFEEELSPELQSELLSGVANLESITYWDLLSSRGSLFENKNELYLELDEVIKKIYPKKFRNQSKAWDSAEEANVKLRNKIAEIQDKIVKVKANESLTEKQQSAKIDELRIELTKMVNLIPETGLNREGTPSAISLSSSGMSTSQAKVILNELGYTDNKVTSSKFKTDLFKRNSDGAKLMKYIEEYHDLVTRAELDMFKESGYLSLDDYNELSKNRYYIPLNVDMAQLNQDLLDSDIKNPDYVQSASQIAQSRMERLAIKDEGLYQKENTDKYIYDTRISPFFNGIFKYNKSLLLVEENNNRKDLVKSLLEIQNEADPILKASEELLVKDKVERQKLSQVRAEGTKDVYTEEEIRDIVRQQIPATGTSAIRYIESGNANGVVNLPVFIDGKTSYIEINDAELAKAFTVANSTSNKAVRAFKKINRFVTQFQKAMFVTYSPYFLLKNNFRDAGTVMITQAGLPPHIGKKIVARTLGQFSLSLPGAAIALFGGKANQISLSSIYNFKKGKYSEEELADGKSWAYYYSLYKEAGAESSWINQSSYDVFLQNQHKLLTGNKRDLVGAVKGLQGMLMDLNNSIENNYRLIVFKTAYEELLKETSHAEAIRKAAIAAKYVTVNFEDSGTNKFLNSYKLFFNAAVQGTYNLYKYSKIPRVRRVMTGLAATGVANRVLVDFILESMGGEDDKWTKWRKEIKGIKSYEYSMNYIIPITPPMQELLGVEQNYFRIPLPYGFNAFKFMGDAAYRNVRSQNYIDSTKGLERKDWPEAYHGYIKPKEAMLEAAVTFMNNTVPVKLIGQDYRQILAPTVISPFVNAAINKNYQNTPLYTDLERYGPQGLHFSEGKKATSLIYKDIAKGMFNLTGWDNRPEQYAEITRGYMGSFFATMGENTYESVEKLRWENTKDIIDEEKNNSMFGPINNIVQNTLGAKGLFKTFMGKARPQNFINESYEMHANCKKTIFDLYDCHVFFTSMDKLHENEQIDDEKYDNMIAIFDREQRILQGIEYVKNEAEKGNVPKEYAESEEAQIKYLMHLNGHRDASEAAKAKVQDKNSYFYGKPFIDPEYTNPKSVIERTEFRDFYDPKEADLNKRLIRKNRPKKELIQRETRFARFLERIGVGGSKDVYLPEEDE